MPPINMQRSPHRFTYAQPEAQATPQPQDNGLLSLIPFYDIAQKAVTGRGNEITAGEVGLEAALTFLPFGKIAKGASMLAKGAAKTGAQAAETTVTKGTSQLLTGAGSKLRGMGRDIRPGTLLPGSKDPLDITNAARINSSIDAANTGLIPRTGRGQLMGVQKDLNVKGAGLEAATNAVNRPIDAGGDVIGRYVAEGRNKLVGFDPANRAHANLNNNYADRVAKAKDLKALEAERKNFDAEAKRLLKNPDAQGTLKAQLAVAYRNAIDKYVAEGAPSLKAAKGEYRTLRQAEDLLSRPGVTSATVRTPVFGGPLPFVGDLAQMGAEVGGKTLQAVGGSSPLARIGRNAAGQVGRRAVVDPLVAGMQPKPAPSTLEGALAGSQGEVYPNETPWLPDGTSGPLDPTTRQPIKQNPYPRENLIADMQRDPANADEYLKQYQMYQELFAPEGLPELTAGQQSTAVRAQSALGDIDVIAQAIESGDIDKGLVPFSDNALVGNALGMGDTNAALYNLGDIILRSRTGAAAPKEEVEKFIAGYLPRAGESRETKLYKLQRAQAELMGMINPPAALGAGTANTLEDALNR